MLDPLCGVNWLFLWRFGFAVFKHAEWTAIGPLFWRA